MIPWKHTYSLHSFGCVVDVPSAMAATWVLLYSLWKRHYKNWVWWKALKCKSSAHYACAVSLITGARHAVTRGLPLYTSWRRVWHGLATLVDCMRESIHVLRCNFLCLQGTRSRPIGSRWASAIIVFAAYLSNAVVSGKSPNAFWGSRSSEAVGIAHWPLRSL